MKTRTTTAIIGITLSTLTVGVASISILFNYEAEAQQTAATQVLVGGANNTYPFFGYSPQQVQIKAGGSVVWKASTSNAPPEPHTVTFVFNNKTTAGPEAPFAVPSSTQFMPLPPGANSKPFGIQPLT
ncbi:MAG: hypothetical protein M3044_20235 [Thermoproteota archaeon]|nr:hypothetical protein [Thermoproteota archaeon]